MDVKQTFAARLKALREEKGISQAELGVAIGMTRGSISFYESGSRTPDIETLDRVHKYFDVSVNYLLGYSEAGKEENEAIGEQLGLSDDAIELLKLCHQCWQLAQKFPKNQRPISYQYITVINRILEMLRHGNKLLYQIVDCMETQRTKPDDREYSWFEAEDEFMERYPEALDYLHKTGAEILFCDQAELFHLQELRKSVASFFENLVKYESRVPSDRKFSEFILVHQGENSLVLGLKNNIKYMQELLGKATDFDSND